MTNTIPSIFVSGGCGPGGFDREEPCLSEALLRNPNGGAVAFFGYARSASDGSHRNEIFQTIFRDRPTFLGEAIFNCKATLASRYADKPYHHYMFNLQGDPLIHLMQDESGRQLQLLRPRGCEVIEQGSDLYIRWNAAGTGFEPDEKVRLEWSGTNGQPWNPIPGAQALSYNAMLFIWEDCPLPAGFHYRVRVTSSANPAIQDSSSRDFAIGNLRRLTVKSSPVRPLRIDGPYGNLTNYDVTVLPEASVSLTAPLVPQEAPELAFRHWSDELGTVLTDDLTYMFTCNRHATVVAQYGPSGLADNYYVNDDIPEDGIAAGDDRNDGRSPQQPMRSIQALLSRYPNLSWLDIVNVSSGVYTDNISLTDGHSGLTLSGAGQDRCVIDGGASGSCIWLEDFHSGIIRGFTIRNGAADVGGGINCGNSLVTVKDCTFSNNDAIAKGGGLYIGRGSDAEVSGCRFMDNTAKFGGGVYNLYCTTQLTNCILAGNSADRGAALFNGESTVTVRNCTFSKNVAGPKDGGIANYWDSTTTVLDSILWGDGRRELRLAGGAVAVIYSDIQGGWPGDGNIDVDPLFVDPANGDYHLKSQAGRWERENRPRWVEDNVTSPCIDAGDPLSPAGDEPEPNGRRINMGAYGGTAEASKLP